MGSMGDVDVLFEDGAKRDSRLSRLEHMINKVEEDTSISLKNLEIAVQSLSSDLSIANRLIAQNMFAVVRLELSGMSDEIATLAINAKNQQTGKGKAKMAINSMATLGILAGTALSAGGLAALGGLIVASGNAAKGLAKSDASSFVGGLIKVGVSAGNASSIRSDASTLKDGGLPRALAIKSYDENSTTSVPDATAAADVSTLQELAAEHVGRIKRLYKKIMMNKTADVVGEVTPGGFPAFNLKYSNTAFKDHGSGGESALQYDVQRCLYDAYSAAIEDINSGLMRKSPTADDGGYASMVAKKGGAIEAVLKYANHETAEAYHPLTKWVMLEALRRLRSGGNYQFMAYRIRDRSKMTWNSHATSQVLYVNAAYTEIIGALNAGKSIPNEIDLTGKVVGLKFAQLMDD
ncbi:MAG: hypothetical protein ABGX41_03185 [Pseudohongiella sp.]